MEEMQFTIDIYAPKQKVWDVLWQDKTFREWAGIIDPGTYMVGELKEGDEVQFMSSENGYGVTSLVKKLIEGELLILLHSADTQEAGTREREKEWTGGEEMYHLSEKGRVTTLIATMDVPSEMEEYFTVHYPEAFDRVRQLAECKED